jgi:hypothetical protein
MENSEGYYAHGLASSWPSCLGWLGLGWQPIVKNRGGRGAMARSSTGRSGDVLVARGSGWGARAQGSSGELI